MKTILITGGTSGIGKGLAMYFLKKGNRVIVVGSSPKKGESFYSEAKQIGAAERAVYLQADLSLVRESQRIVDEIKKTYGTLDMLILCATLQKYRDNYTETEEGFELIFALYYLSRYVLSYGLIDSLEKSPDPVILNVCAPGMGGGIQWDNLQYKNNFKSMKVLFNGSRLNDLLGVGFAQNNVGTKIKYILFNPMAVRTPGVSEAYKNPLLKLFSRFIYGIIGKSVDKAIEPMVMLLENPPQAVLSAYKVKSRVDLEMKTFDTENAEKLYVITTDLLKELI